MSSRPQGVAQMALSSPVRTCDSLWSVTEQGRAPEPWGPRRLLGVTWWVGSSPLDPNQEEIENMN